MHDIADAVAFSGGYFGAGSGTIYLDEVGCTGIETRLIDCSRSSYVYCRYGHSEDAGVRCQGFKNKLHLSGYFVDYVCNIPCVYIA